MIDLSDNIVMASTDTSFNAKYPNIFDGYRLPYITSDKLVKQWSSNPMQFWQNQLNFAVWCATSGCGISMDNLEKGLPLTKSLFQFHVYYQIRRILKEISVPIPADDNWNALDNCYDIGAYERICDEFNIPYNKKFYVSGPNNGLGRIYFSFEGTGKYFLLWGYNMSPNVYDTTKMDFNASKAREDDTIRHRLY